MINVVTAENRDRYEPLLRDMHRDRKRVFVDRLKWTVPVVDGDKEIDQFDHDGAVYLIISGPDQRHLGSARLLPSTRPHILGSLFPQLCAEPVPVGPHIWEMTRLVYSPELTNVDALNRTRMMLRLALVEFALSIGIRHYSCIVRMDFLPTVLSAGWVAIPLGFPTDIDGELTTAVQIDIDAAALRAVRDKYGFHEPVLTFDYPRPALAA